MKLKFSSSGRIVEPLRNTRNWQESWSGGNNNQSVERDVECGVAPGMRVSGLPLAALLGERMGLRREMWGSQQRGTSKSGKQVNYARKGKGKEERKKALSLGNHCPPCPPQRKRQDKGVNIPMPAVHQPLQICHLI